jgi:hypothetical protein
VPFKWPGAAPPLQSEPNAVGLASPGTASRAWETMTAAIVETPLGWPIAWIVVAVTLLASCRTRPLDPARHLAIALLLSAIALEASFAVLSIASDLRYHLWPMIATALAAVLLAEHRPPKRTMLAGAAIFTLIVTSGITARLLFPRSPQTYAGMLG